MDKLPDLTAYHLGHWTIFHERWLNSLSQPDRTTNFAPGTILMADLGATNFGHEPMFEHPCVVLINDVTSIFVAPCSSQQYGRRYTGVIDATAADGFQFNTGIQMNYVRWIDKKRMTNNIGAITNPALIRKLESYMIELFPTYQDALIDHAHEVALLENAALARNSSIQSLNAQVQQLKNEIAELDEYKKLLKQMMEQGGQLLESFQEAAAAAGVELSKL
ncbi:type II toxin-antitoxin system PemK/MazF family toxin [Neobacillus pocheonensis]|uniref:type II toxin-antitoxin system PemK/MazF family toxin n=1 Tax=Neobacillus pocheonensis TaxID=363869 RepID=UPI003D2E09A6